MWFQAAECNAVNASLLLNLINNNFLIFYPRIFPFWIPTYPKNPKICAHILVNLLKMRPHYSHSSRKNATPSSGTSLLASYKGVPPPPFPRKQGQMSHTTLEKSSVFLSPSGFKVVRSVSSSASLIMVILPSTCNEIEFLFNRLYRISECQRLFYEGPTERQTICMRKFSWGWVILRSQIQFYNAQHSEEVPSLIRLSLVQ